MIFYIKKLSATLFINIISLIISHTLYAKGTIKSYFYTKLQTQHFKRPIKDERLVKYVFTYIIYILCVLFELYRSDIYVRKRPKYFRTFFVQVNFLNICEVSDD